MPPLDPVPPKMRLTPLPRRSFIALMMLAASVAPVRALSSPVGVWIPVHSNSAIKRIHISGTRFNYTAMIDYSCGVAMCSTLQDLSEDLTHPLTFSARLEGVASMPFLELRWQPGPPCNRGASNDNLLVVLPTAIAKPTKKPTSAPRPTLCFASQRTR